MTSIAEALEKFRRQPSPPDGSNNPFRLLSTLEEPARPAEVEHAWSGVELPSDAAALWKSSREARLFEDIDYGQWGLSILSPSASATRTKRERDARPMDFEASDIVLGEFLGDQELLVLAPAERGDSRVLIALPLDGRRDWFAAAPSLGQFLDRYFQHSGNKYWEEADRTKTAS